MKSLFFLMTLGVLFCSCYRMPGEDDCSTIPATNNPHITCEKSDSMIPGMKY